MPVPNTLESTGYRTVDGEAIFLAELPLIEQVISFVCRRNHLSGADAEDFASHARLKLLENDYAVLRKFQERSSLKTYLVVTIQRLFLDYRIAAWGKWRPSTAARRMGPTAVLLEQLLVRDGYTFEQACEVLTTNYQVKASPQELDALCGRLPVRTRRRIENDDALVDWPVGRPPEDLVEDRDQQHAAHRLRVTLQRLLRDLVAQDRLILALRFEDGRSVAAISTLLGLEQKPLYRRLERLLLRLREGLEANGVNAADVSDLLDAPVAHLGWGAFDRGKTETRPSVQRGADE
jgi:RNA polymerase sigma factor (sigma-70 family)